jgi:hypothetical protein
VEENPSTNGVNGKNPDDGRFVPGNKLGKGNPHAKRVAELKAALLESETPERVTAVMGKLYELAIDGDVAACKEYLNRLFGKEVVATIEQAGDGAGGVLVYLPGNVR